MKILYLSITTGLLSLVMLTFAYNAYPPLQNDSVFYWVPIVNLAGGHGLTNTVDQEIVRSDKDGRYLLYPPLMQMVMGRFLRPATSMALYRLSGWMDVFKLILMALVFWYCIEKESHLTCLCACAGLAIIASLSVYHIKGRPEGFAQVFLIMGLLASRIKDSIQRHTLMACLLGAMAACHPFGAAMAFALTACWVGWNEKDAKALRVLLFIGSVALVTMLGLLRMSPYGLLESFRATRDHAHAVCDGFSKSPIGWRAIMCDRGILGFFLLIGVVVQGIYVTARAKRNDLK